MQSSQVFSTHHAGVFGFDLGTTNSVISAYDSQGLPTPITTDSGPITPSCILFESRSKVVIGTKAYRRKTEPSVAYSFKRHMGTSTPIPVEIDGVIHNYTAKELSKIFVSEMFKQALHHNPQFGGTKNVVVSVPAYFDVNQIKDTKEVFDELGYNVVAVQVEPIAASLVFQQIKRITDPILVFDLGGGTFDAVLITSSLGFDKSSREFYERLERPLPNLDDSLEVIDIYGDNRLGGDDADTYAVEFFLEANNLKSEITRDLIHTAEFCKKNLVSAPVEVNGSTYNFDFSFVEKGVSKVLEKCMVIVEKLLSRNGYSKPHCVLCGGSTKSTIVRDALLRRFVCSMEIDPDLAVSLGDAMACKAIMSNNSVAVISKVAKHLGVYVDRQFTPIVHKGSVMPAKRSLVTSNAAPFASTVDIMLYQCEDLVSTPTPVHKISLTNLTGHDANGKLAINLKVSITLDGVVTVSAMTKDVEITSSVGLASAPMKEVTREEKWLIRFKKIQSKRQILGLDVLISEFEQTLSPELAKKIDDVITSWGRENGR